MNIKTTLGWKNGLQGVIVKECPTKNSRGAKRYLIRFTLPDSGESKSAKLYSDEIDYDKTDCAKNIEGNFDMEKYDNKIVREFYNTALSNIESKYESKMVEIKKADAINYAFTSFKKDLANKLDIPMESLQLTLDFTPTINTTKYCVIDNEPYSIEITKNIENLNCKKHEEIGKLKDICNKANTIIQYTEDFNDMCEILTQYGIMKNDTYMINDSYGLD